MEGRAPLATVEILYHPQGERIRRGNCVLDPLRAGAMEEGSPEGTAIMEVTPTDRDMLVKRAGSRGKYPPTLSLLPSRTKLHFMLVNPTRNQRQRRQEDLVCSAEQRDR